MTKAIQVTINRKRVVLEPAHGQGNDMWIADLPGGGWIRLDRWGSGDDVDWEVTICSSGNSELQVCGASNSSAQAAVNDAKRHARYFAKLFGFVQ